MSKKHIIIFLVIILLFLVFSGIGFYYHDEIEKIINGETWNYIDNYEEVKSVQSLGCFGRKNLCICTKEGLKTYSNNKLVSKQDATITGFMSDSNGIYSVLFINDSKTLYLIKNGEIVLTKSIDITPKMLNVNKNGYIIILYSQIGYKTGIKVYKSNGEEILTTYLANSYATCAKISNDEKSLLICEVDSSGIKVKSKIKSISLANKEVDEIDLPLGRIALDIKNHNNKFLVKADDGIYEVDGNTKSIKILVSYDDQNVLNAYIEGSNDITVIKEDTDSDEYVLVYYNNDSKITVPFNEFPQDIDIYDNTVVLNFGSEIWIIKNGHLKNKIAITEALSSMNIFSDGKELALVFRNAIKVFKI